MDGRTSRTISYQQCISATWVTIFAAQWLADLVEVKKEKMGSLEVGEVRAYNVLSEKIRVY